MGKGRDITYHTATSNSDFKLGTSLRDENRPKANENKSTSEMNER